MIRIVKLTFKEEHRQEFIDFVSEYKTHIESSRGCEKVDFLNDIANPNILFTYSHWESENHLNEYRNSDLFAKIWPHVKQWFDAKPEAWSVDRILH